MFCLRIFVSVLAGFVGLYAQTTASGTNFAVGGNSEVFHRPPLIGVAKKAPSTSMHPEDVVFAGDNVVPQVVDGGGWKTTFKFVNLENHPVSFTLYFVGDNGSPLALPILGSPLLVGGVFTSIQVNMVIAGSVTIETAGSANTLAQGWAYKANANTNDSIGGFAIFRQRIPGQPDQEAVVPIVNQFSNHFVLLYDNPAFVTGIAISNPTTNAVSIPVVIRNDGGQVIDREFIALGPLQHTAFSAPAQWPATAGGAGGIEFLTSGFGVAALGLRFNGIAFTSFAVLENFAWIP